nr:hypothetical protein CFP56_36284 [Quercus suber]
MDFFYHLDYSGPVIEQVAKQAPRTTPTSSRGRRTAAPLQSAVSNQSQPLISYDCSTKMHAKVFSAAVRYQIPALSTTKFKAAVERAWDNIDFCDAVHIAYMSTPGHCTMIRDVVKDTIMAHKSLLNKTEMKKTIESVDGLAYELLQVACGLVQGT